MSSIVQKSLSIYKEEGFVSLVKSAYEKFRPDLYSRLLSIRGRYSLSVGEHRIIFSAPTAKMVTRNRGRFSSEQEELEDFIHEIKADDVVYDIGANTGLYTLFAANKCPTGEVIAFEPYPPNHKLLKKDIERNQLNNVRVVRKALSDSSGHIEFRQPSEDDVGFGSSAIETNNSNATTKVATTTGDELIVDGTIPKPNVVKIDVEGAEPLVINGLQNALSGSDCRTIYCEVHLPGVERRPSIEDFGCSPRDIKSKLETFGFSVKQLYSRESEIFLKGEK